MLSGINPSISSLLPQLGTSGTQSAGSAPGGFSDLLKSALGSVDQLQTSADQNVAGLLQGASTSDASKVMVSVEKADIAFQLMMQVRNKVVSAYQDIEKMQF